jgi:ABC-2 type transport system permease protein
MTVAAIVKRELKTYFTSPIIYIVVSVFLIITGYFFYTSLVMCVLFAGTGVSIDLWEYTFNDISYIMLLLLPLISMRLFAEEKKLGTIELLFTNPLRDADILLGKYIAGLLVISLMLLLTALYPLLLAVIHTVPVPVVIAGYAGLFLIGACFLACGMFLSSLTEHQSVAAISTTGLLILFWFIDRNAESAGEYAARLLKHLSLFRHFFNFARGVIDTKNIIYFVSVISAGLLLTLLSITSRHWKGMFKTSPHNRGQRLVVSSIILIVALIPFNVLGTVNNRRFDFTPEKKFTLSQQTHEILQTVQDQMGITLFGTKEQRLMVEDMLERMQSGCRYMTCRFIDVEKNPAKAEALRGSSEKPGIVEYQGRREYVASLSEADVLKTIHFLTQGQEKVVSFTAGHGEKDLASTSPDGFSAVYAALQSENYALTELVIDDIRGIPVNTFMVIVAGPRQDFSAATLAGLGRFFEQGGRVLLLLDSGELPQLSRFLAHYNVEVGSDVIVDRQSRLPDMDDLMANILINREHAIGTKLSAAVLFPCARSVQVGTTPVAGLSWEILGQSGRETWAERTIQSAYDKTAQYQEGEDLRGPVQAGVIVKKTLDSSNKKPEGRMVVLGSARFAANEYFSVLGNRDFFLGITGWLAEDTTLASVLPVPRVQTAPLVSLTVAEGRLVFWSCIVIQPVLFLIIGIWVILRRRYAC